MRTVPSARLFRVSCAGMIAIHSGMLLSACGSPDVPLRPTPVVSTATALGPQPAGRCVNVEADGTAPLAFPVTLPNGTTGFGANWFEVTLGDISGQMASVLLSEEVSGGDEQGTRHLILQHAFQTRDGDYLITSDRAVCAPAGPNPLTCRVNDVLTIVEGTGTFSNANGSLRNHGVIDFAQGTLGFSIRGRICGDGL